MGRFVTLAGCFLPYFFPVEQGRGEDPIGPGKQYVFVQIIDRAVGIHRGQWMIYGLLNADGDLIPENKHRFGAPMSNLPSYATLNFVAGEPRACYEFHSGRLIKGEMTSAGRFVPETGSAVIRFEDYKYSPTGPDIWNLPGTFMRKDKLEERRKWLTEHAGNDPKLLAEKAKLDAAVERKK